MAREDRFEKVFEQGMVNVTEIWVDRVTGVQYVFHASGYAGGLTRCSARTAVPLLCDKAQEDEYNQQD